MFKSSDVSVVIPAHNCESFIIDAIQSVEKQTCPPREIIVVENASSDKTFQIVSSYAQSSSVVIRIVRTDCPGVSNARNTGFSIARTDLIAMLDADDEYRSDFIEVAVQAFNAQEDLSLFFGNRSLFIDGEYFDEGFLESTELKNLGAKEIGSSINVVEGDLFSSLLQGNFVSCSAAVVRKERAYQADLFPVGVVSSEDRKFFCRLDLTGKAAFTWEICHYYRIHGDSKTKSSDSEQLAKNGVYTLRLLALECERNNISDFQRSELKNALSKEAFRLLTIISEKGSLDFFSKRYGFERMCVNKRKVVRLGVKSFLYWLLKI